MTSWYRRRSAWARREWTAGPLPRFSSRYWMQALSAARAISPPRASSSRTRWPLPVPPMAGLQGMLPTASRLTVKHRVLRPSRAPARAASMPACPAPITAMSYVPASYRIEERPHKSEWKAGAEGRPAKDGAAFAAPAPGQAPLPASAGKGTGACGALVSLIIAYISHKNPPARAGPGRTGTDKKGQKEMKLFRNGSCCHFSSFFNRISTDVSLPAAGFYGKVNCERTMR